MAKRINEFDHHLLTSSVDCKYKVYLKKKNNFRPSASLYIHYTDTHITKCRKDKILSTVMSRINTNTTLSCLQYKEV
jgi:hypothetical protein